MSSTRAPRKRNDSRLLVPSESDIVMAEESSRCLGAALERSALREGDDRTEPLRIVLRQGGESRELKVPDAALVLLQRILAELAAGSLVEIHPVRRELTTQQAADLLYVSRPYLIGLLDRGEIPSRKVGTHRRVLRDDVLNYKQEIDEKRKVVLDALVAEAQELGMGY